MSRSRLEHYCLLIAVLLGLVLLLCGFWHPAMVVAATLAAAVACINVILGCLLLAMVTPLVRGIWQPLLLPGLLLGVRGVPLIVPMLLPILLGVRLVYPWAQVDEHGFRGGWLSPLAFCLRSIAYGAVWWVLQRWVIRGSFKMYPAGVIIHVLLASLAAVDWLMSLQPAFFSSLFGLLQMARQLLDGLAFAGLIALLTQAGARVDVLRALLVAVLGFWVYLQAVQYLIIWTVNLPHEVQWYLLREQGLWAGVTALLASAQLLLLVGLASPWGRQRRSLLLACPAILVLGALEALWMSLPSLPASNDLLFFAMGLIAQLAYAAGVGGGLLQAWRRNLQGGLHGE